MSQIAKWVSTFIQKCMQQTITKLKRPSPFLQENEKIIVLILEHTILKTVYDLQEDFLICIYLLWKPLEEFGRKLRYQLFWAYAILALNMTIFLSLPQVSSFDLTGCFNMAWWISAQNHQNMASYSKYSKKVDIMA